jgi:hypothetical protein
VRSISPPRLFRQRFLARGLARISHPLSGPAGCGVFLLRYGSNCPRAVSLLQPFGKSGPRVDTLDILRATLRVVSLRLTSLRSVDLRFTSLRSGCKRRSSRRLVTKGYEKCRLERGASCRTSVLQCHEPGVCPSIKGTGPPRFAIRPFPGPAMQRPAVRERPVAH